MRLLDLDAQFISDADPADRSYRHMESLEGAQGVSFQCPTCGEGLERGFEDGRGHIKGAHYINVWFSNPRGAVVAPEGVTPTPRWQMEGSSLDDLTLAPSINCDIPWRDAGGVEHPSSCKFHGYVKNGDVT